MKKLLTILACSVGLMASAAINPAEFTKLDFNVDYPIHQYKEFKGKITAPESGVIIEYGSVPAYVLTSSKELQIVPDWTYAGFINGKQAYQFEAKAGTTYYIFSDYVMDDGVISFALNPKVKILNVSPAAGSVYDIAANEFVDITANQNITIGKATVSVNELSAEVNIRTNGSSSSIIINEALTGWYEKNQISGGETIKVEISEITDGMGNPADNISLEYIAAGKPYTLVSQTIPDPILSWYPADSENAKATFTFSGPVAENPEIELCYSPVELGYEYIEVIPATVNGNTITIDLSGKLRTPDIMSPTGLSYNFIDIRLYGIKDNRGQYMLAPEGSIGSFHIRTPFKNLDRINFAAEFTPPYGSDLSGESEIKIECNNLDKLNFSGMIFKSGAETATVAKSAMTVSDHDIVAAIPEGWTEKSNVIVSLDNLSAADGLDHTAEFSAKYNGFAILFSNPAEASALASLAKGRTITIDTNLNRGEAVTFTLLSNGEAIYGPVDMTEQYEGQYIHAMENDITLYAANKYVMQFDARGTTETVTIVGQSVPFEFSDIEFVRISPEEGSAVKAGDELTVEFTGLVYLEKLEGSADFTAQGKNESNAYDYMWAITLPEDISSDFSIIFSAYDESGSLVKGNSGTDRSSCFVINYKSLSGIFELTVPDSENNCIFDINGRRLSAPIRGINIINGHKVLVR